MKIIMIISALWLAMLGAHAMTNTRVIVIEKTCHFTWQNNPTQIPAEHYGRKNYNESAEMFGAPDKVECE